MAALLALSLLVSGCAGRLDPRFLACVISGGDPDACLDVIALVPPAGVVAVSSQDGIDVSWDDVPGASSYRVARADVSGGPYTEVGPSSFASFSDSSVMPGRPYFYVIYTIIGERRSDPSAEVSAVWEPDRPRPPTGLQAESFFDGILLSWDDVPGAISYVVARSDVSGGPYDEIAETGSTNFSDTSVEFGPTYFYVVYAQNRDGLGSGSSAEVSATWSRERPAPPAIVAASSAARGIHLSWSSSSDADGYVVGRADESGGPYAEIAQVSGTRYDDESVAVLVPYFYVVYAVNAAGRSDPSDEVVGVWLPPSFAATVESASRRHGGSGGARFDATFTPRSGSPGSLRLEGGRLLGSAASSAGTFELTIAEAASTRVLRGTWSSTTDFALELPSLTGTEAGFVVGTLENGAGTICLRVRNEYSGLPGSVHGAFMLAGAEGLLASTAYTGRVESDGIVVVGGSGSTARSSVTGTCAQSRLVFDFRSRLAALRAQLAALEPRLAGRQAKVRLGSVLEFLDRALDQSLWEADGNLAPSAVLALRQLRMAVSYARSPNAELSAATAPQQLELCELARSIAELRYGIVLTNGGATSSRLANARSHLDLAAATRGTPAALEQAIKAWDNLDG